MSRHRYDPVYAVREAGDFLLAGGVAIGLGVALFGYFAPHNGIDGSWGALLVVVSTALVLGSSLVLALFGTRSWWLRLLLGIAILLGLIGTALAAYFLESTVLVAMMIVAFVGWIIRTNFAPAASTTFMQGGRGMAR